MDQTSEERDKANRDKVKKFLELKEEANRKGQVAFIEFNTKYYNDCRDFLSAGTEFELGTKAKQISSAQTEPNFKQSSAAQTEPQLAPAGHGESPIKDKTCDGGTQRWQ